MYDNEWLIAESVGLEFKYPNDYKEFLENQSKLDLSPWWLIGNKRGTFNIFYDFINTQNHSSKLLIPFAKSDETNILACFDIQHRIWFCGIEDDDIENANWDERYSMPNFSAWLHRVLRGDL